MDIDFIKWMCEKAEGFEYAEYKDGDFVEFGRELTGDDGHLYTKAKDCPSDYCLYPLLLQRAIEGVNREDGYYRVEQAYNMIEFLDSKEYVVLTIYDFAHFSSIDQAKESALKHIFDKE